MNSAAGIFSDVVKTSCEKEKMLATIVFSVSNNILKNFLPVGRQSLGIFDTELKCPYSEDQSFFFFFLNCVV